MSKKRIDIPDDLTSKLVGSPSVYASVPQNESFVTSAPTPSVLTVEELPIQKNVGGRPVKPASANRVKYTTAISKDLIRFLRVEAALRDMTSADLLEIILSKYKESGLNI